MNMKDIAMKFCNLEEGEYIVETKIGNIEVACVRDHDKGNLRVVNIKINNETYMEIIYSNFESFRLRENIYHKDEENKYKLVHDLNIDDNRVEYTNEFKEMFEVSKDCIINRSNHNNTYNVKNGIIINSKLDNKDMVMTYDLEKNKKSLHIKKGNCENDDISLKFDFVTLSEDSYINMNYIINTLVHHNNIVEWVNNKTIEKYASQNRMYNSLDTELNGFVCSYSIPTINIEEVKSLASEIDAVVDAYKKSTPLLSKYHSDEMLEILYAVANELTEKYSEQKNSDESKEKGNKVFNLSNFKNK